MQATMDTGNLTLFVICGIAGVLAIVFFISIFVADAQDAKRRRNAKRSFERAQKYFTSQPPTDEKPQEHRENNLN